MNALKNYIDTNSQDFKDLADNTERQARGEKLFKMIADTYQYESHHYKYLYLSPYPNVHCGIHVDVGNSVILSTNQFRAEYCQTDAERQIQCQRYAKLFKTQVKTRFDACTGSGAHVYVAITIPKDWETNSDVMHDIAVLCGKIFDKLK